MHISFLYLIITLTIASVTADIGIKKVDVRLPVHRPEEVDDKNPENVNVLLSTLFEMHHNLLAQISLLEDKLKTTLATMEKSEIKHMVEHYTAQKNNIELSIQQIQSNDGLEVAKERSIAKSKDSAIETKTLPFLGNFFKRNQNPIPEQSNANIPYALQTNPYRPTYYEPTPLPQPQPQPIPQPIPQPQPTFVYQAAPQVSVPQVNPNGQVYVNGGGQSPVYYQDQPSQQFAHAPQLHVPYSQVQATVPEPQYQPQYQVQSQPQLQYQHQVQADQQIVQVTPYSQDQGTITESQYQTQSQNQVLSQLEEQQIQQQYQEQLQQQQQQQIQQQFQEQIQAQQQVQTQQQIQPQQQLQPQQQTQQQQFDFESVFRPSSVPVRRPQVAEYDSQRQQQAGPLGQKEGIFVYYPNGMITDDKDRPSIANRVGQAFDRFGQAISNFGGIRQPGNNPDNAYTSEPRFEVLATKNSMDDKKKSIPEGEIKQEK